MKEMKNKAAKEEETWADKFGQGHKKLPFPEQPKDTVSGVGDPSTSAREIIPGLESDRVQMVPGFESNRVQSAPNLEKEQDDR